MWGERACYQRQGNSVGINACIGVSACERAERCESDLCDPDGDIGQGACHGDPACFNNPSRIPAGACVGLPDPVTGKGVCEL